MQRFFEELDELKIQQGEAVEPRAKKMKLQQPIDMIEISGAAPMAIPEMGGAMETSGMGHSGELMGGIAGAAIPTVEYDDAPLTKKGGRPKLPLFSVRPNRQKSRTSEVMAYIRKFAVKNQENVDEILWSLLMLRVQGSNNQVIAQELKRLYGEWLKFISPDSETLNPPMGPLPGVSVIPAAPGTQQMELDVSQMPQQTIHTAEDYHMQGLQLTDNGLIENENEIVTHV